MYKIRTTAFYGELICVQSHFSLSRSLSEYFRSHKKSVTERFEQFQILEQKQCSQTETHVSQGYVLVRWLGRFFFFCIVSLLHLYSVYAETECISAYLFLIHTQFAVKTQTVL